jgi:hypothetical protein
LKLNAGLKPTPDGTFKVPGEALPQYVLENENGAKAIIRTFGCNAFSYITKDGIEVFGTRADAPDIKLDSKPHAGGAPHCFPQVILQLYILLISNFKKHKESIRRINFKKKIFFFFNLTNLK